MPSAAQATQHSNGVFGRRRLAERVPAERNHGVRAEDDLIGCPRRSGPRLLYCQPSGQLLWTLAGAGLFIHLDGERVK